MHQKRPVRCEIGRWLYSDSKLLLLSSLFSVTFSDWPPSLLVISRVYKLWTSKLLF